MIHGSGSNFYLSKYDDATDSFEINDVTGYTVGPHWLKPVLGSTETM